jgi:hypothetical protein
MTDRVEARWTSSGGSGTVGDTRADFQSGTDVRRVGDSKTRPELPKDTANLDDAAGRRVRLRPKPGTAINDIYGSPVGLMSPLFATRGLVFPYQPVISYQQEVMYSQMEMVHTNQDILSYVRTPSLKMTVEGDFSCQTQEEGSYALACIHFLRTVTKMWFGGDSEQAVARQGTPPPVLLFDAYGQYMFNNLPVVVTNFSVTLPKDVDYFPVKVMDSKSSGAPQAATFYSELGRPNATSLASGTGVGYAWLPVHFMINIQLTVQNTPKKLRSFDMTKFRTGELIKGGGWV